MNLDTFSVSPIGGFLFATFKGEWSPLTEQVYFGLSQNGRDWQALNKGEPVLVSLLSEEGVRDPFLVRSPDGAKFWIIATDLSIHHHPDWNRAVRAGSRQLLVWESDDLKTWSEPYLVPVAPTDAGCAWAPEAVFDEQKGEFLVFWASTTGRDNFGKHRIWAAHTPDFKSFTEPFVWIDRPHHVIDTDVVWDEKRYFRFSKDEEKKAIQLEWSDALLGQWSAVPDFSLANLQGVEGPQCFLLEEGDDTKPPTWCLLLDFYATGQGYKAFLCHDLSSGQWENATDFSFPFRFRHGSVLPLSRAEYSRLKVG